MNRIDKLAWLQVRDRRVLAVRSHGREHFFAPGGKREPGEDDHTALTREIREELTVELDARSLQFAHEFRAPADGRPNIEVRMRCYFGRYLGELSPSAEIAEQRWLSSHDSACCSQALVMVIEWLRQLDLID